MLNENRADVVRPSKGVLGLLPYLLDLFLPIATYFALKAVGVGDFWALAAGGLLTAVNAAINTARQRKLDSLGLLVLLELALGLLLTFATRDPRLLLARPSLYIALAGLWVMVKAFSSRPVTVDASKPMAYKGDPRRLIAYEWCAANSEVFQQTHRRLSTLWGLVFIAYALVRLVIIYSVDSIPESIWLNEVPGVIGIVICLLASKQAGERLEKVVDERMTVMFPASPDPLG